ncbi:hypothetical protein M0805_007827 [Coniferiporia weirii]|nr:hypothetical protein M0805_007827 [Coniferiporia weirii]
MTTFGLPYFLEDRTGDVANTEFNELYDRMFFGVAGSSRAGAGPGVATLRIFELGSRSSSRGPAAAHFGARSPAVVLDFASGGAPGTVLFVQQSVSMPMTRWLTGSSKPGKPIERTFRCFDNEEYRWTHQADAEAEWVCTTSSGYVAAQYKLRMPDEPKYVGSSGNMFTVYESYGHIAIELLAALTIVRHVHRHSPANA